jgi:hypothetical protein
MAEPEDRPGTLGGEETPKVQRLREQLVGADAAFASAADAEGRRDAMAAASRQSSLVQSVVSDVLTSGRAGRRVCVAVAMEGPFLVAVRAGREGENSRPVRMRSLS